MGGGGFRRPTQYDGASAEEWAARTLERFATADGDRDRALNRAEFATTAPRQRRTAARRQNCDCTRQAAAGGARTKAGGN